MSVEVPAQQQAGSDVTRAQVDALRKSAKAAISAAISQYGDRTAIFTRFGARSSILLHLAVSVKPDIPIVWVDPGNLSEETYSHAHKVQKLLHLNLHVFQPTISAARLQVLLADIADTADESGAGGKDRESQLEWLRYGQPLSRAIGRLCHEVPQHQESMLAADAPGPGLPPARSQSPLSVLETHAFSSARERAEAAAAAAAPLGDMPACLVIGDRALTPGPDNATDDLAAGGNPRPRAQNMPRAHFELQPLLGWSEAQADAYISVFNLPRIGWNDVDPDMLPLGASAWMLSSSPSMAGALPPASLKEMSALDLDDSATVSSASDTTKMSATTSVASSLLLSHSSSATDIAECARLRGAMGSHNAHPCKEEQSAQHSGPVEPAAISADARADAIAVQRRGEKLLALPRQMSDMLCKYVESQLDRSQPTVRIASPDQIRASFIEAGTSVDLGHGCSANDGSEASGTGSDAESTGGTRLQDPTPDDVLKQACELVLKWSVRTAHPHFMNQLYGRVEPAAVVGDWLSTVLNTNSHTYEVAPVNTLLEDSALNKMASIVGGKYAAAHDGLLVPGGSIANLYAMHLARATLHPDTLKVGTRDYAAKLVAFTSPESHYSYLKSARLMGLGAENLREVPVDDKYAMRPEALSEALEQAKREGLTPFFVGATCGTTVFGAFDPLEPLAAICAQHNVWLHADAAWGGAILLSATHRKHYMQGIDLTDSLAWNPHKTMGCALQCSALLTRHVNVLKKANSTKAAYLFQPDKKNTELDVGDKTIQCGRKTDAIKLWMQWKALGDEGLRARVDHGMAIAQYWVHRMTADSPPGGEGAWVLVSDPSYVNICFWYVPPSQRPFRFDTASEEQKEKMGKVAPAIKDQMQNNGQALVGFQSVNGFPNFWRLVLANVWSVTFSDVDTILETFDRIGREL